MCLTIGYLAYSSKVYLSKSHYVAQMLGGGGLQPQSPTMGSATYEDKPQMKTVRQVSSRWLLFWP